MDRHLEDFSGAGGAGGAGAALKTNIKKKLTREDILRRNKQHDPSLRVPGSAYGTTFKIEAVKKESSPIRPIFLFPNSAKTSHQRKIEKFFSAIRYASKKSDLRPYFTDPSFNYHSTSQYIENALIYAAKHRNPISLKACIDMGVGRCGIDGQRNIAQDTSPLLAFMNCEDSSRCHDDITCVEMLINYNADLSKRDSDKKTALDYALILKHTNTLKKLLRNLYPSKKQIDEERARRILDKKKSLSEAGQDLTKVSDLDLIMAHEDLRLNNEALARQIILQILDPQDEAVFYKSPLEIVNDYPLEFEDKEIIAQYIRDAIRIAREGDLSYFKEKEVGDELKFGRNIAKSATINLVRQNPNKINNFIKILQYLRDNPLSFSEDGMEVDEKLASKINTIFEKLSFDPATSRLLLTLTSQEEVEEFCLDLDSDLTTVPKIKMEEIEGIITLKFKTLIEMVKSLNSPSCDFLDYVFKIFAPFEANIGDYLALIARKGNVSIIDRHISYFESVDSDGRNIFHSAIMNKQHLLVENLINKIKTQSELKESVINLLRSTDDYGCKAIHFAASLGGDAGEEAKKILECMRPLDEVWEDINTLDNFGFSPLKKAIFNESWEAAKFLLTIPGVIIDDESLERAASNPEIKTIAEDLFAKQKLKDEHFQIAVWESIALNKASLLSGLSEKFETEEEPSTKLILGEIIEAIQKEKFFGQEAIAELLNKVEKKSYELVKSGIEDNFDSILDYAFVHLLLRETAEKIDEDIHGLESGSIDKDRYYILSNSDRKDPIEYFCDNSIYPATDKTYLEKTMDDLKRQFLMLARNITDIKEKEARKTKEENLAIIMDNLLDMMNLDLEENYITIMSSLFKFAIQECYSPALLSFLLEKEFDSKLTDKRNDLLVEIFNTRGRCPKECEQKFYAIQDMLSRELPEKISRATPSAAVIKKPHTYKEKGFIPSKLSAEGNLEH